MSNLKSLILLWALAAVLLAACEPVEQASYEPQYGPTPHAVLPEYTFGIHPQRNPKKLHAVFGPLIRHLNRQFPEVRFVFEASRNYESYDRKIAERRFEFLLPNPYETLLAIEKGYHVFAKQGRDADLRGLFVARRDSDIRTVADLKGKAVSFPASTALAAYMLPMYFLHERGLDPRREIEVRYVGSMESSLLNVLRGNVAAGTVFPPAWRMFLKERPAQAGKLHVLWETDSLPHNSVMARNDVPAELVARVEQLLLTLHESEEGRRILAAIDSPYFEAAGDSTYDPVRAFMERYRQIFGKRQ